MRYRATCRTRTPIGVMNKLETDYASYLETLKLGKEILEYWYEAIKFRLADNTYYTPDFSVVNKERELEFHEVKGFWEDHAKVKIKVAAAKFPFRFIGIQKVRKQWKVEEF